MTDHERAISLKIDAIILRLERGCNPLTRWWLRFQKRHLECYMRGGWR